MKKVLITGAGRGIGLALTKEFVAKGYQVIGTYRDASSAKELLQLSDSSSVIAVTADLTDESTFGPLKEQLKNLKSIDILINNAGVIGEKASSILELDLEGVREVLDVNTLGPMRMSQLVIPFMNKSGIVAQITSQMGSISDNKSGGYYDYRMSKAALNMFNMCLSKEFTSLTCLTLHPGWVKTDMGGAGATVTTKDCAAGLFQVITSATSKQTGEFYNFKGEHLPW
ncbi:MAG: SDR family oxidoreductase [Bdellovibrionales bacterium]